MKRIDCFLHSENYKKGNGPAYLRVVFSLNVPSGIYTTEGPYGVSISPDKASNLEKPTLTWQDLSNSEYGVSLINDSKYGGDREGDEIKLSLISHPEFDRQEMLYSFYPHRGDWREGNTPKVSYEVNYPLIVKVEKIHEGILAADFSFLKAEPENIIVSVLKKHEDSEDAILRIYETLGRKTLAKIVFEGGIINAYEIDMMEWERKSKDYPLVNGKVLEVSFSPYEIKTFRIRLPKYFGNKILVEYPSSFLLIKDSRTNIVIKLNNSTEDNKSGKIEINFPEKSYCEEFEIKSGEIKEITFKIDKTPKIPKGFANLKIIYGKNREEKTIPYEIICFPFEIKDREFSLYKIYEAEELSHKTGREVKDSDSLNKICWCAEKDVDKSNEHIIFGPYEILPVGRYLVSFKIKISEKVKEEIAVLDVFSTSSLIEGMSEVKTFFSLKGENFKRENKYEEFPLIFRQVKQFGRGEFKNEFRVFWKGKSKICVDRIAVFKILSGK
jgi:hypothetical protein